ncbi:MAG: VanW family protein [Acidimicrobiia bacterium]|nr:VanW family protein [Acidimicrobiia bacterium]
MSEQQRRLIIIGAAVAVVLLPLMVYALDSVRGSGEVARNVTAAGVELGGLGEEDAISAMREYESQLANTPAVFTVNGTDFVLEPTQVGLDVDEEAVVAEAMEQRRDVGFFSGFFSWFGSFGDMIELDVPVAIDPELLDDVLDDWEVEAIDLPAYEGGIIVQDTRVLPDYPRPGEGIDRIHAEEVVTESLQTIDRRAATLRTMQIEPQLTNAEIDGLTIQAARWIDAPVTLAATDPEFAITFSREELAEALVADVRTNSGAEIDLSFDAEKIGPLLTPYRSDIEQPPRDAELLIDQETTEVTLVPSRPATLLDVDLVVAALGEAADSSNNEGEFPFGEGVDAAFTTADAEAMGDIQFVSGFTTEHPAGQARVINIQLFADAVDGAMVLPGEEFSLNEHVGQRTTEKGYVPATMIQGGDLVDDVGGGVSQFATTFYNAVFYGCYENVFHKPHSYYFSRYPEVNEATISWPQPHLIFRNNTETVVIIKTSYTDTSITVQFYGDNEGCEVERQLGSRYAYTDPKEEYVANPELNPDEEDVTQRGWGGFSNTVKRVMRWPDGRVVEEDYVWKYNAAPKIIEVHPCRVPPEGGAEAPECPVQAPSVIGGSIDGAREVLEGLGLTLVEGAPIETTDESQDGVILAQSPSVDEWLEPGSAVTVQVGVYVPPEED